MESLTKNVIIPFKIKIVEKPRNFDPRTMIFKLEQVLKFNDICNFLNPENRSFENVSIVTFK